MITDINIQHELLKTALHATDGYLGIEESTLAAKMATPVEMREFLRNYTIAHSALMSLGVLNQHEEYMQSHLKTMNELINDDDSTFADNPYAPPMGAGGSMDESPEFYADAKKRAKADTPQEKLSSAWKTKAKARAAAAGRKYPNLVDNVWAARQQESIVVSFNNFITEKKQLAAEISEEEINSMADSLSWDDIYDLYEEDEIVREEFIEEKEEELDEAISAQSRLKRRQGFARFKGKRGTFKGIKLKRTSTPAILQKRAQVAARRALYKRILQGRDKATLSASEKDRVEKQIKSMGSIRASLAIRMIPKIRAIEQKRLKNYRAAK
jgi:hypothetical protein